MALATQKVKSAWPQDKGLVFPAAIKNDITTVSKTSSDVTNQCKHQDKLKVLLEDMKNKYSFKVTVMSIRLQRERPLDGSNYTRNCICEHLISVKIEKGLSSGLTIIFHLEALKITTIPTFLQA